MAQYLIEVNDDYLDELQQIVADIHVQQPTSTVTEQSYLQGIVLGLLRDRIISEYLALAKQKTMAQLKTLLGDRRAAGGN
jgi:hypothetical protein